MTSLRALASSAGSLRKTGLFLSIGFAAWLSAGCDGSPSTTGGADTGGSAGSAGTGGGQTGTDTSAGGAGGGAGTGGQSTSTGTGTDSAENAVTFHYKPGWQGVTAVRVIGGFGQAKDWDPTQPLLELADDGTGEWKGAAMLPPGKYLYVFQVVGDAGAKMPATFSRYAVDPSVSAFQPCPDASPTYSKNAPNPCSEVSSPPAAEEPTSHVTGKVVYDGKPAAGYLVVLERDEPMSHHFFLNRVTTADDGTFDLGVVSASVRLQAQHPTMMTMNDIDVDPVKLAAFMRALSASFTTASDVAVPPVEMAYHDYGKLSPKGSTSLPTTFQITLVDGAAKARAAIYGASNGPIKNVGDPWWASMYSASTSVAFDGTFNTAKAAEMKVQPGEQYLWGTWQQLPAKPGEIAWTGESMVLPIAWQ